MNCYVKRQNEDYMPYTSRKFGPDWALERGDKAQIVYCGNIARLALSMISERTFVVF
jgi:hypothetical protein